MKRITYVIFSFCLVILCISNVNAKCSDYNYKAKATCEAQVEDGYKCVGQIQKGALMCKKGTEPVSEPTPPPTTTQQTTTQQTKTQQTTTQQTPTTQAKNASVNDSDYYILNGVRTNVSSCQSLKGVVNEEKCNACVDKDGFKYKLNLSRKGWPCEKTSEIDSESITKINETITSCSEIKSHEECTASKVNGHYCKWMQNACYNGLDSGDDETSIAGNKEQKKEIEADKTKNATNTEKIEKIGGHVGEGFCSEKEVVQAIHTVGYLLFIAKMIVPFIIIIFGIIDLTKGILDPDKIVKTSVKSLCYRLAIGLLVFFAPTLIDVVLDMAQDISVISQDSEPCRKALLDPWNYADKASEPKVGGIDYETDPRFTSPTKVAGIDYETDPRFTSPE